MMATSNSRLARTWLRRMAVAVVVATAGLASADEPPPKMFAAHAQSEYQRTRRQYELDPQNATNVWQFAEAVFNVADFSTNKAERAAFANQGIVASRALVAREPEMAAGHYYLAMNLGQLARTETLGALAIVKEMEREFKIAADLDQHFDYGGPARDLGLLYRDAPGWPLSIGNPSKARSHLRQAVRLAPDYPENYLNLIEAYLKWNDADSAKRELRALDIIWPSAESMYNGEKWAQSWDRWKTHRAAARKAIEAMQRPGPNSSRN